MSDNPEKRTNDTKRGSEGNVENPSNEPNLPQPPLRKQDPREPVKVDADSADTGSVEQAGAGSAGTTAVE
jgi:hypothetical protein